MLLQYSFIIPVFNRPDEIQELLQSFETLEGDMSYEIVIVEDGSTQTSRDVVETFTKKLNISYFFKENTGPGDSRNFGMKHAKGNYFIILDSDCILSKQYLIEVEKSLKIDFVDCFGGPDAAHDSFSNLQKAINFSMTSFVTTGGIRGHKKSINKFQPRSFNMGLLRKPLKIQRDLEEFILEKIQIYPSDYGIWAIKQNWFLKLLCIINDAFHGRVFINKFLNLEWFGLF